MMSATYSLLTDICITREEAGRERRRGIAGGEKKGERRERMRMMKATWQT